MQSTSDKAGVGRAEHSRSNAVVMLSVPITFASNVGLIAITIWSFFVLPWLSTLGVVAIAFIGFSLVWGMLLATWRRAKSWGAVVAAGLPLVFVLRLVCAAAVVFLGISYVQGAR